jgi:hypothetical protein
MSAAGIDGLQRLDALTRKLDAADRFGEDDAPELAATAIGDVARAQFAAGQSPAGETWAPRKKDGGRALANAQEHVRFAALGQDVYEDAPDHYKYHRTGTKNADGSVRMVKRNVYAEGGRLPPSWTAAVEKALERELTRRLR